MEEIRKTLYTAPSTERTINEDRNALYFRKPVAYSQNDLFCPVLEFARPEKKKRRRSERKELRTANGCGSSPNKCEGQGDVVYFSLLSTLYRNYSFQFFESIVRDNCLTCRKSNSSVGCAHESASRSSGKLLQARRHAMESGLDNSIDEGHEAADEQNDDILARTDEQIMDLRDDESDSDSNDEGGVAQTVQIIPMLTFSDSFGDGEYCANMRRRSPVLCTGEVLQTREVVDSLLSVERGEGLHLTDPAIRTCPNEGCGEVRSVNSRKERRTVTLHLVANPPVKLSVDDWYCPRCRHFSRYFGEQDGIFPATYTYAYSVELMYLWVWDIYLKGRSFRDTIETMCQNSCALSTLHRHGIFSTVSDHWKGMCRGCRIANSAFRIFC